MSQNRLLTADPPNSISENLVPEYQPGSTANHSDPDECELFRLATHIVQYDEALTEILVKIALRKAELSEAG